MATATSLLEAVDRDLDLWNIKDACWTEPKYLVNEIKYYDPTSKEWVAFRMFPPEGWECPISELHDGSLRFSPEGAADWYWQSVILDWLHHPDKHAFLIYKARQLGMTLLACAYALWLMLFEPGSACVAYSYEEDEAKKLVEASWAMYKTLPPILTNHVEVITPRRAELPSQFIRLQHQDGRISTFQALPATEKHGHGARVRFAILDEEARQDYARGIWEAIVPAVLSRGGKAVAISTASGVSNLETGEGNFFHHQYAHRQEYGLEYIFLPWNAEPTRDDEWYQNVAMKLPEQERNRQYPLNAEDGFLLSGDPYFDTDSVKWYFDQCPDAKYAFDFMAAPGIGAKQLIHPEGIIKVWREPDPDGVYAISVDTSTGRSQDYSSCDVIDLSDSTICATLHSKIEAPRLAYQLYFLGKWFNTAKIAVERGGGYGEAVIIHLRDGTREHPAYTNLYRHRTFTKGKQPIAEEYGFPMTGKSRTPALELLKTWVYQQQFPFLPLGHIGEMQTFVYKETTPSPRAQDGCNDDRVMSLAIAVEMYRQYGMGPKRAWKKIFKRKKKGKSTYKAGPVKAGG